jgi:glutaconate CoA-transferase subunit B
LAKKEELLAGVIARLIGDAKHVAVGAASPIPAAACELLRAKGRAIRVTRLHKRQGNPFSEGSRELFDLAGQGRIDTFFLGGAQIDGEANINLVRAEGKRFPGSFGSAFLYFTCRTILFREEHSRRVLVPKVEFISAPGWSLDDVRASTGFDFDAERVAETPLPSAEDLALLRSSVARQLACDYPEFARRVWGMESRD